MAIKTDEELKAELVQAKADYEVANEAFLAAQDDFYGKETDPIAGPAARAERDTRKAEVLRLYNLVHALEREVVDRFTA